jgi:hypothetical protein
MKTLSRLIMSAALFVVCAAPAASTPSTIIWISSTDIQGYGIWHLGIDNYFSAFKKGLGNGGAAFPTDIGLTVGVFSSSIIGIEAGVDYLEPSDSPWLLYAKIGTPEGALWSWSPAFAVGVMNVGFLENVTNANIVYGAVAKNIGNLGRVTVGYFSGNPNILMYGTEQHNTGVMASWDRTMKEISDNLWLAVDYQDGKSAWGAMSVGAGWAFTENITLIVGYDFFNNDAPSTLTTQLDINL